ncbi:MAG: RHS repeat domain-containing protein, partial [Candidatus Binataceae bacterium]
MNARFAFLSFLLSIPAFAQTPSLPPVGPQQVPVRIFAYQPVPNPGGGGVCHSISFDSFGAAVACLNKWFDDCRADSAAGRLSGPTWDASIGNFKWLGLMPGTAFCSSVVLVVVGHVTCPAGTTSDGGATGTCSFPEPPGVNVDKSAGCRRGAPRVGNPCDVATGNKYQAESDGPSLIRYYNSGNMPVRSGFGWRWRHDFERAIEWSATNFIYAARQDGRTLTFRLVNGIWQPEADVADRLTQQPTGWTYRVAEDDSEETYDAAGRLMSITDRAGAALTLSYSDGTSGVVLDANGQP